MKSFHDNIEYVLADLLGLVGTDSGALGTCVEVVSCLYNLTEEEDRIVLARAVEVLENASN